MLYAIWIHSCVKVLLHIYVKVLYVICCILSCMLCYILYYAICYMLSCYMYSVCVGRACIHYLYVSIQFRTFQFVASCLSLSIWNLNSNQTEYIIMENKIKVKYYVCFRRTYDLTDVSQKWIILHLSKIWNPSSSQTTFII